MSLIYRDSGSAPVARVYPTVHNDAQQNYPNLTQRRRRARKMDTFFLAYLAIPEFFAIGWLVAALGLEQADRRDMFLRSGDHVRSGEDAT